MPRPNISTFKFIGKRFGKIEIVDWVGGNSGKAGKWVGICDCGEKTLSTTFQLIRGKESCFLCSRKEIAKGFKKSKKDKAIRSEINNYRNNAKGRGLVFDLTDIQAQTLLLQSCTYCGKSPEPRGKHNFAMNGIDRVDNNLGYTLDNCAPCCKLCNNMKKNLDTEEFLNHITLICNFNKEK